MTVGIPVDASGTWNVVAHYLVSYWKTHRTVTLFPDPDVSLSFERAEGTSIESVEFWNETLESARRFLSSEIASIDVLKFQPGTKDLIQEYSSRFDFIAVGAPDPLSATVARVDRARIGRVITHSSASVLVAQTRTPIVEESKCVVLLNPNSPVAEMAEKLNEVSAVLAPNVQLWLVQDFDNPAKGVFGVTARKNLLQLADQLMSELHIRSGKATYRFEVEVVDVGTVEEVVSRLEEVRPCLVVSEIRVKGTASQSFLGNLAAQLVKNVSESLLLIRC